MEDSGLVKTRDDEVLTHRLDHYIDRQHHCVRLLPAIDLKLHLYMLGNITVITLAGAIIELNRAGDSNTHARARSDGHACKTGVGLL